MSKDKNSKTDRATILDASSIAEGPASPRLIVVSGMLLGHQVELGDAPIIIGRASDCSIALPHPSVSRQHCRIWREDKDRYFIEDLGSTNRTYLNGKEITRADLRDGDQISIGNNALKFFTGSSMEARYHHELIDLAIYDSLTGFYNRRHFRTLLDEEVDKSRHTGPFCLLMLDLDHFKAINDEHGHLVGDHVLGAIAQILREHAPPDAPIGRLGGEEFALIMRETRLAPALLAAEKIRAAIAVEPILLRELTLPMTLSIGVADSSSVAAPTSSSGMLRVADEQLYQAKQDGRNRVSPGA